MLSYRQTQGYGVSIYNGINCAKSEQDKLSLASLGMKTDSPLEWGRNLDKSSTAFVIVNKGILSTELMLVSMLGA